MWRGVHELFRHPAFRANLRLFKLIKYVLVFLPAGNITNLILLCQITNVGCVVRTIERSEKQNNADCGAHDAPYGDVFVWSPLNVTK